MIVIVAFVRTASALAILCYTFIAGATLSACAGLSGLVQDSQNGGRLAGGIGDPNFTAAVLIPAIALGLFMALAPGRSRLYRAILLGTSGLCMVGVFLTQSRGGVIALGVVFLLAVVFAGRARAQVLGVSLVVVSTAAVYSRSSRRPMPRTAVRYPRRWGDRENRPVGDRDAGLQRLTRSSASGSETSTLSRRTTPF